MRGPASDSLCLLHLGIPRHWECSGALLWAKPRLQCRRPACGVNPSLRTCAALRRHTQTASRIDLVGVPQRAGPQTVCKGGRRRVIEQPGNRLPMTQVVLGRIVASTQWPAHGRLADRFGWSACRDRLVIKRIENVRPTRGQRCWRQSGQGWGCHPGRPTHTPTVKLSDTPMAQASRNPKLVPVFHAIPRRAPIPASTALPTGPPDSRMLPDDVRCAGRKHALFHHGSLGHVTQRPSQTLSSEGRVKLQPIAPRMCWRRRE